MFSGSNGMGWIRMFGALLLTGILTGTAGTALAAGKGDGGLKLSTTYEHSTGDYGLGDSTDIDTVAVTLDYGRGPWALALTIPYVRISGFGTVTMGAGGPLQMNRGQGMDSTGVAGAAASTPGAGMGQGTGSGTGLSSGTAAAASGKSRTTEAGLGDVTVAASYAFTPERGDGLRIEAGGLVKLATADEAKGLGTGEMDYSLQLDISRPLGAFVPFFVAGYTLTGDSPETVYNNTFFLAAGSSYRLSEAMEISLSYGFREKATDAADDLRKVSLALDWKIGAATTLGALLERGLSDAAPEWTAAVRIGAGF